MNYLLNNVTHEDHDLVVLDLPSAGLTATRYGDGSITLQTTRPERVILSTPSANLLAELLAGNLEAPTPGWTEGDVVTFTNAGPTDRLFTLRRNASGSWALHTDGRLTHPDSAWSDGSVDSLLAGDLPYGCYKNPTVAIRQADPR